MTPDREALARTNLAARIERAQQATPGPWVGTRLLRRNGRLAVTVTQSRDAGAAFVLTDTDPEARLEDAAHIAGCSPDVMLEVYADALAVLDQHQARVVNVGQGRHQQVCRSCDLTPWPCPDAARVLRWADRP